MLSLAANDAIAAAEPDFGPNVLVVEPGAADVQQKLDAIFTEQEAGQFNSNRHAILLKPGTHALNIQVGFYTHVIGLGSHPNDVQIVGTLDSKARWMRNRNATCNFWRSAENVTVTPHHDKTHENPTMIWAVSQAAPLRRVHVKGDLHFSDGGWSSGGFLADALIDGTVNSGTQQQWFSRNSAWNHWLGGNWNMMFLGTTNPPKGTWPDKPYTTIERTPLVREKPFLCLDQDGYAVMVPPLARDRAGVSWSDNPKNAELRPHRLPLSDFHIARADRDTAESINAALAAGKHLLFTPGIYSIDRPIAVTRPGTVVLGMGYPTLRPQNGAAALTLADVPGLSIAGLLIDAGETESNVLIEVGPKGARADHSNNPTFLYDLFCRAGGAINGRCHTMMEVNSSHVVAENLWLWRADHGAGAEWDSNLNKHGLVVRGNDVTMYGLFVEHQHEYQTIWQGERGRVYFYQSEMPYDPPAQEAWMNGSTRGFASYKVADDVKEHQAIGLGVYCVFWDAPIIADRAIEAPVTPGVKLHHMIAVRLNGKPDSGISRVLNDLGEPVIHSRISRLVGNE